MDNLVATPSYTKEKKRFPKKLFFLFFLLLILCAGGFIGVNYFLSGKSHEALLSPATSPTITSAPTNTPTPSPSPVVSPTPSGSVTPTKAAVKSATSTRSETTISILNGSGVAGAASKISATLKDLGYQIGTVGNADTFDYTDVTINVKKSKSTLLTQLKKDLSDYTIGSTSATLKETNTADAVVIVGK